MIAWLDEQDEASLYLSVITIGEIGKGILKLRATDPRRSQKLTAWLGKVEQRFAGRILPLDAAALHVWAQISAQSELAGQPLPVMDSLMMTTAQCHGFTVVTHNVQDFAQYPQVFNPWDVQKLRCIECFLSCGWEEASRQGCIDQIRHPQ